MFFVLKIFSSLTGSLKVNTSGSYTKFIIEFTYLNTSLSASLIPGLV